MKVKPPKDYSFRQEIWELVDKCCEEGQVPACRPPTYVLPSKRETVGKVRPRNAGEIPLSTCIKGGPGVEAREPTREAVVGGRPRGLALSTRGSSSDDWPTGCA